MYRLLIVENESIEREAFADLIDWTALGVELAGIAESAEDAINLSHSACFDILLTDVRPLGLSGLELGRSLMKTQPRLKIIINSDYGELDRSRQALEARACSFIRKPIDHRELQAVVRRVVKEIEEEREQARSGDRLRGIVHDNMNVIRGHFFERLLAGSLSDAEIVKSMEYFGLNAVQGRFAVILAELDGFDRLSMSLDWEGLHMMLEAIRQAVTDAGIEGLLDCHYIDRGRFAALFNLSSVGKPAETTHLLLAAERIRSEAAAMGVGSITAGIGSTVSRIKDIRLSFRSASAALAWKSVAGKGQVVSHADASAANLGPGQLELIAVEEAIAVAVETANAAEARNIVDRFFNSVKRMGWDEGRVGAACLRLLSMLLMTVRELGESEEKAFGGDAVLRGLLEPRPAQELRAVMNRCVTGTVALVASRRTQAERAAVQGMIEYINRHVERRVNAEELAGEFGYTPNYIGVMFQNVTGLSLADNIKDLRMVRARELLKDPANRIGEVAIKVGYPNVSYFCTLFKNKYGVNPMDIKEKK